MVRNTRAEVGIELPPRQAQTVIVETTNEEQEFCDKVNTWLKRETLSRMAVVTASRMLGSLPGTAIPTLTDLGLKGSKFGSGTPSKVSFLEKYLKETWNQKSGEKILVFTQFSETHRTLVRHFSKICGVAQIFGGQDQGARDQEVKRFQDSVPLLISTDAGSEGRNLQFCHHLVNFDIPWNPMRLEQRTGRLHRYGQKESVTILNLCGLGSIEEVLLDLLDRKLNLFELVVGELSSVLGEIESEKSFEERVSDLWIESDSLNIFREKMDDVALELVEAKGRIEKIQKLDEAIFS